MDAGFRGVSKNAPRETNRCWSIEEFHGWNKVSIKERIDSFNQEAFQEDLNQLLATKMNSLAVEVSQVRFLSLKAIQFLGEIASRVREAGFRVALVAPSEKLKRQIDIYAKLERWEVFRSLTDLADNKPDTPAYRDRNEGPFAGF
jgi:anti-anti-sigma factor